MNIFSTDIFLETMGESFFPERRRSIEVFQVGGQTLRLLVLDGHEIVRTAPYYDFPQALEAEPHVATKPLGYFPRAVVRVRPAARNEPLARGRAGLTVHRLDAVPRPRVVRTAPGGPRRADE